MKVYKIEISPTNIQIELIKKTFGVCSFVYNLYIAKNIDAHDNKEKFISGFTFSKWLNNEFIINNPDKIWIKEVSSKAVKKSIMNAETSFKKFFKKQTGFPKFKKKGKDLNGIYLPKNNKTDFKVERNKIKIPCFGWIHLKEFGYLPKSSDSVSATITSKAGKYFISVLTNNVSEKININLKGGIGVDLGIKNFTVTSNKMIF